MPEFNAHDFDDGPTAAHSVRLRVGDWVRYTEEFCRDSTTEFGYRDTVSRRGKVVRVFDDGKLCDVDWGDYFLQHRTDSPSIVITDAPDNDLGFKSGAPLSDEELFDLSTDEDDFVLRHAALMQPKYRRTPDLAATFDAQARRNYRAISKERQAAMESEMDNDTACTPSP